MFSRHSVIALSGFVSGQARPSPSGRNSPVVRPELAAAPPGARNGCGRSCAWRLAPFRGVSPALPPRRSWHPLLCLAPRSSPWLLAPGVRSLAWRLAPADARLSHRRPSAWRPACASGRARRHGRVRLYPGRPRVCLCRRRAAVAGLAARGCDSAGRGGCPGRCRAAALESRQVVPGQPPAALDFCEPRHYRRFQLIRLN